MASNKRLNATITIGGAVTGALKNALGTTRDKLQEIGTAVRKLEREQRMLGNSITTFGSMGKNVDGLRARYAAVTAEIEKTRAAQAKLKAASNGMATGKAGMASAGVALGATAAAAATAFIPVVQAVAFEKAMLGVAKQVDGARDSSGKLTQVYFDMAKQIQLLGREMPMATNEIADMVAAGARMGIAKDELIDFTRTAGMMASAFDLPAGELADQMGKIATLFKIPIPRIGELADVINYLDDNAISKGGDIIEVMKRIGGTAEFVKMPAKEAAALASTFLTLGSTAEVAATAANAAMRELSIATMQPKRFQKGLVAIGLDAKKLQQDMTKDATGTILKVLDALNKLPDEKRLTVATQLFGKEYGDDIAKLATGVEEYRRQLNLAKSDGALGSMLREHQARLQTTTAQWEIAKNRVTELGVNIGMVLLPAVNQTLSIFGAAASAVADFSREHPVLVGNIATVVGTLGGLFAGMKLVAFGVGAVTFAFNAMRLAMMTNPIGLVVAGLATAAALIYQNWEPISRFFSAFFNGVAQGLAPLATAIAGAFGPILTVIKPLVLPVLDLVGGWFKSAVSFVGALITPVEQVGETSKTMAEMATSAGKVVGEVFRFILTPIELVANAIKWVNDNIGGVIQKAAEFFGVGGNKFSNFGATAAQPGQQSAAPQTAAIAGQTPPPVPRMATAAVATPAVNATQNNTINITQQPGQDAKALAAEVQRQLAQQKSQRSGAALYDYAMGY